MKMSCCWLRSRPRCRLSTSERRNYTCTHQFSKMIKPAALPSNIIQYIDTISCSVLILSSHHSMLLSIIKTFRASLGKETVKITGMPKEYNREVDYLKEALEKATVEACDTSRPYVVGLSQPRIKIHAKAVYYSNYYMEGPGDSHACSQTGCNCANHARARLELERGNRISCAKKRMRNNRVYSIQDTRCPIIAV